LLESETGGIGLRFPDYKFITDFVKYYKKPVTATSANMAGRSPHYSVQSLLNSLSKSKQQMIDLIVDAGTLPRNKPSAVIDLTGDKLKTIREGDINVSAVNSFISDSAEQTFKLGKYIMQNIIKENKAIQGPIVIILKGDLGAGKTVFVKGVAEYLNIFDIVSPTYVIYYEYNIEQNNSFYNKLFHYDLYNIEDDKEFSYLGFQEALKSNNIICLEWGEKLGDNINLFKERGQLYILNIKHLSEEKRELVLEKVS
jgi:tRNA threonylcarbamoyl adenosine modification protein YjeE